MWQAIVSLSNLGIAAISKLSKLGMAAAIPATLVPPALQLQAFKKAGKGFYDVNLGVFKFSLSTKLSSFN